MYWSIILIFFKNRNNNKPLNATIGITTFLDRYTLFKDQLKRINYCFPDTEIIIAINGHYKIKEQKEYLKNITQFCKKYPNVFLIKHNSPVGLSKLWNEILKNSNHNGTLLLNDDLFFKNDLNRQIIDSDILSKDLVLINNSFSHYYITKNALKINGMFDEKLIEIGGEDDDFIVRCKLNNINVDHTIIKGISNFQPKQRINSYGKNIKKQTGGYSSYNTEYLKQKWIISNEYFLGAINVERTIGKYWKLRNTDKITHN